MRDLDDLAESADAPFAVDLRIVDVPIRVTTNAPEISARLHAYYPSWVCPIRGAPAMSVRLIQGEPAIPAGFVDVTRGEARPVKEATQDRSGRRLILKRATGVVMGVWPGHAFAVGDLLANLNQGINLINACYAKVILDRGYVLFHASAVSGDGRTVVLAGSPGAGKSTSALHLVESGLRLLSNDRVLARAGGVGVEALGYPKQPRVNPGTLLHHPRLAALLDPRDAKELAALSREELWQLERKSDVDVDSIYGPGTFELSGRMEALLLLKWRPDGRGVSVRRLDPSEAMANLPLFRKDLGVFDPQRSPGGVVAGPELARYAAVLERVTTVEVTGGVDFPALVDLASELLAKSPAMP
jgi:HprK-related kinase B